MYGIPSRPCSCSSARSRTGLASVLVAASAGHRRRRCRAVAFGWRRGYPPSARTGVLGGEVCGGRRQRSGGFVGHIADPLGSVTRLERLEPQLKIVLFNDDVVRSSAGYRAMQLAAQSSRCGPCGWPQAQVRGWLKVLDAQRQQGSSTCADDDLAGLVDPEPPLRDGPSLTANETGR